MPCFTRGLSPLRDVMGVSLWSWRWRRRSPILKIGRSVSAKSSSKRIHSVMYPRVECGGLRTAFALFASMRHEQTQVRKRTYVIGKCSRTYLRVLHQPGALELLD